MTVRLLRRAIGLGVLYTLLGVSLLSAQDPGPTQGVPARVVVFARADTASAALAQAVRKLLGAQSRYVLLQETDAANERQPTDSGWTIEQKRERALALDADAFLDIETVRVADISRVTVACGVTTPFRVDMLSVMKQGSVEAVARSVVERIARHNWPASTQQRD